MKAAVILPNRSLKIEERPTPTPGTGEVVVKVAYCGICGSDLHMLSAGFLPAGAIIGHELSGTIDAVGSGVEGWEAGDRVCVMPLAPCFECQSCRDGNTHLCLDGMKRSYGLGMNPGAFAEFMKVKPSMLFRLPDGFDLKTAAINEPCAVAVRGVTSAAPDMSTIAVVMGAGPIGLLAIKALRATGTLRIYASEPDPYRADLAQKAGAHRVFNPKKSSPAAEIVKETGHAADVVFDCAGTETSTDEAVFLVKPRGRIVVLGVHQGQAKIFPLVWFAKEASINFSFGYTYKGFGDCLKILANKTITPEPIISDIMPLSEIDNAFKLLKGSGHSKILIDCQAV